MSDERNLLKAVIDNPDDDLPRHAYADWCIENGQELRGEFIQAQLRLDQIASLRLTDEIREERATLDQVQHKIYQAVGPAELSGTRERDWLMRDWNGDPDAKEGLALFMPHFSWFDRGFIFMMSIEGAHFAAMSSQVPFLRHPITTLVVVDHGGYAQKIGQSVPRQLKRLVLRGSSRLTSSAARMLLAHQHPSWRETLESMVVEHASRRAEELLLAHLPKLQLEINGVIYDADPLGKTERKILNPPQSSPEAEE